MNARLTATHAAFLLGIRERAIVSLARKGKIPHRRIGKEYTFDEEAILKWWEAQPGADYPATLPASPAVTKGITATPEGTAETPLTLVEGPRGTNRTRLKGKRLR